MKKKVLSVLLAGVLAVAMVACSSSSDSSSDTEETTEEEEVEEEAEEEETEEEEAEAEEETAEETEEAEEETADIDWTGETITIGSLGPLTGSLAQYGTTALQGIQLAIAEINEAGGIYGAQIELIEGDDQSDATECVNAFNTLASQGVELIVGTITSGNMNAVTGSANDEGIVMIAPSATADSVTTEDNYIFRACYADSFQGQIAAAYAYLQGYTEVGVVYCSADTYSAGLYDAFVEGCELYGVEVVAVEATASLDTTEYTNQFTAMVEAGVEFVYAPFYYDVIGPYVVSQARAAGYDGLIMGADGYDTTPDYVSEGSDLTVFNDVIWTNHYDPASDSEVVQTFVEAFEAEYGDTPSSFAALGYDCVYILKSAIERAGSYDADDVRDALADTSIVYECVTGTFSFDETGTPVKGAAIIEFTSDGTSVETSLLDTITELPEAE